MNRRDILICTVGTSLKSNLENKGTDEVRAHLRSGNHKGLALALLALSPDDRLCGAEINSITSIVAKGYLAETHKLALLVSDTEDGRFIGQVLRHYYEHGKNPCRFQEVVVRTLAGLTDADHLRFRTEGLRNLVRAVADMVNREGSQRLVINATGGYKAQISFAGMIGQALDIPVCYLFERFSEVIELPPQPISLDLTFWLEHAWLFYDLAADAAVENPTPRDRRFASLVDEVPVDGETMIGLSPVGQLFHETFRHRFAVQRGDLLPPDSGIPLEEKVIKYEDANDAKHRGLKEHLERLARLPYVKRIYTYKSIPGLSRTNPFHPSSTGEVSHVDGSFTDGKRCTKFSVTTTAGTKAQRDAVVVDLNERFISR